MAQWKLALGDIRELIFDGTLRPGETWNRKKLGSEHSRVYTRSHLRQAFKQLEAYGIVEGLPKCGYRIRRIEGEELKAYLGARLPLEQFTSLGLKRALLRSKAKQRGEDLEAIQNQMERLASHPVPCTVYLKFMDADMEFHAAIARLAGYPALQPLLRELHHRILHAVNTNFWDRVRCRESPLTPRRVGELKRRRMNQILTEHRRILKAVQFGSDRQVASAIVANLVGFTKSTSWNPFASRTEILSSLQSVGPSPSV